MSDKGAAVAASPAPAATSSPALLHLTGPQKVAALQITLGTQTSAKILAKLPPDAIDRVAQELMATPSVKSQVRDAILEETYASLFAHMGELAGGQNYALELFREAFGDAKGHLLLERIHQTLVVPPFDFLRHADPIQVAQLLNGEHPQTIAIILAHLEPRAAARILIQFEPAIQVDVARRIATTEQTTPDAIEVVEEGIKRRMSTVVSEATVVGGTRPLAHVLNQVDRSTERSILGSLTEVDAGLADEVRRFMFVFEDIALLDDRSMQRVVRELDAKDMALALRGIADELREKFFSNMSARAADMLRDEISMSGQVKQKNVEEAQGRIVEVIKRLEDADEIVINRGGAEDAFI
jgi:flagellar motor switch protein FliG